MAEGEKEVTVKITTDVEDSQVQELENRLQQINDTNVHLTSDADTSGTDAMDAGLDEVTESAGEATSALETMALLDIAGTLSQWGSQAESFAQELDDIAISTEQLAIQTGMTDSQMTGMLNNITNATFPREEALMYVQSLDQIGVSAQNLGTSATGLDKINDAFHMGAPAVNKLGQELSVLGVDMNNVSSSFNALAYANANTVGGMENFSKFLTRFDADFNKLGLNVDQAAVAIAGATHKFGGGRAALSGMSSALKECNGDLGKLEQALGLEAGALSNASNLTGQYNGQLEQMAAKEAQHKTLTQQIAAALDDVTASLNGVISPFASFLGMVGNAGSFAVGINGLIQLSDTIAKLIGLKKAENAQEAVSLATRARSAAATIAHTVAELARTAATKAAAAAQALLNAVMMANPVLLLAAALAVLIGYMVYLYSTNEQCRQSVNQLGTDLQRLASGDFSSIRDIGNDLLAASDSFAQASGFAALIGEENYNRWVELRNGMVQAVGDMLTNAGQQIMSFGEQVNTIFQQASLSVQGFINWIVMGFMQVIMSIQQFGMQLLQLPMYIMQAVMQGVANFQSFLSQVSSILNSIIGIAVSFGGQLISQLGSAASNAASSFLSGISGLASGFMGELSSMLSYAVSWASDLAGAMASAASNAVSSFLGALQIHSPGIMQRKFIGEMEGIVTAATDTGAPLGHAMGNVANSAVNNFNPNLNLGSGSSSGNNGSVVNNEFNFVINGDVDSDERMKKFADYIIELMNWDNNTAGRTV